MTQEKYAQEIEKLSRELQSRKSQLRLLVEAEEKKAREDKAAQATRGKVLRNLYYVDEYTFRESFEEGGLMTVGEILGSPDWKKDKIVILVEDDGFAWWIDDEEGLDGYRLEADNMYVETIK